MKKWYRGFGLNPLKSGPTFGSTKSTKSKQSTDKVSIPSNRVLPSVREEWDT